MRAAIWIVAAAAAALGCKVVTSPDGGGVAADLLVGNNFYKSAHNGSQNAAVDTVAVGDTVVWKWSSAGSHQIQSTGVGGTIFKNSVVISAANSMYSAVFKNPGTYPYQCGVHGAAMTGVIVVQ